jgi:hypothetical protein
MVFSQRTAEPLQKLAQSCRSYTVMEFFAEHHVGALLALVLAEPACEADGSIQATSLNVLIDNGEILRVPAREAGTA